MCAFGNGLSSFLSRGIEDAAPRYLLQAEFLTRITGKQNENEPPHAHLSSKYRREA